MTRRITNIQGGGGYPFDVSQYTTVGSHTWTKPANISYIEVWLTGGGGGGGGGQSNWNNGGGGRPGSTVYAKIKASEIPNATYPITIGAGGAGGNGGGYGSNGNNSTAFGFTADHGKGGATGQGSDFDRNDCATPTNDNTVTNSALLIKGGQANMGGGGNSNDDPASSTQGGSSFWGGGGGGAARNCGSSHNNGRNAGAWGSGGGAGADREGQCNGPGGEGAKGCCLIISYRDT